MRRSTDRPRKIPLRRKPNQQNLERSHDLATIAHLERLANLKIGSGIESGALLDEAFFAIEQAIPRKTATGGERTCTHD